MGGGSGEVAGELGLAEIGGTGATDGEECLDLLEFRLGELVSDECDLGGIVGKFGGGDVADSFGTEVVDMRCALDFFQSLGLL